MKNLYLILLSFLLISPVLAQSKYTLSGDSNSLTITGTSSVHDWESTAETISGEAVLTLENGKVQQIEALFFTVETKSIKSGKRIMDSKTKDALNAKEHPQIIFKFTEVLEISDDSLNVSGILSLAGVNKEISLTAKYQVKEDGRLLFSGSKPINMEEFGIKPPTAMMGTLKTGKDVEVAFNISFTKN